MKVGCACYGLANIFEADFFIFTMTVASAINFFAFIFHLVTDLCSIAVAKCSAFHDFTFGKTVFPSFFSITVGKAFGRFKKSVAIRKSSLAMVVA